MITRTAEYAMRAVVTLACHPPDELVSATQLAKETGVPRNYLSTILHALGKAHIAEGVRGPGGGFRLARPANRITAHDVVDLFVDPEDQRRCLLGLRSCCEHSPCPAHKDWMKVWDRYDRFMQKTTIDRMVSTTRLKAAGVLDSKGSSPRKSGRRRSKS